MESVTLELCDSRDYFASFLLLQKTNPNAELAVFGVNARGKPNRSKISRG